VTETCTVLISSAGRRVALLECFRTALKSLGLQGRVIAVDMSPLSSAFHRADVGYVVPRCTDEEFVPRMLEICRQEHVRLIVPTIDTELPVYAKHRASFESIGTHILVSSTETVSLSGDKVLTHRWLVEHGFPTVRQAPPAEVIRDPSVWQFPLVAKPVRGSASIGLARVHDGDELRTAVRGGEYIVQTIAPGREFTVDVLVDREGRARCAVPRLRIEVRAGEVSKGMTVRHPHLEGLARQLCEARPGAYGVTTVQLFYDEASGETSVIEINPRFGGGFPLAWRAGAHYPRWILEELLGLPPTVRDDGWRDGLVMLRYDEAVFVDAASVGLGT